MSTPGPPGPSVPADIPGPSGPQGVQITIPERSKLDLLNDWSKTLQEFSDKNKKRASVYEYIFLSLRIPTRVLMATSIALPTLYPNNPNNGFAITSLLALIFGTALDASKAEEKKITYLQHSISCEKLKQEIQTMIVLETGIDTVMIKKMHTKIVALMQQLPSGLN